MGTKTLLLLEKIWQNSEDRETFDEIFDDKFGEEWNS